MGEKQTNIKITLNEEVFLFFLKIKYPILVLLEKNHFHMIIYESSCSFVSTAVCGVYAKWFLSPLSQIRNSAPRTLVVRWQKLQNSMLCKRGKL